MEYIAAIFHLDILKNQTCLNEGNSLQSQARLGLFTRKSLKCFIYFQKNISVEIVVIKKCKESMLSLLIANVKN